MRRLGDRLRTILARWCRPETMERLVDPAIADVQLECGDALRDGRVWRARRIALAGLLSLIKALGGHVLVQGSGNSPEIDTADRGALRRVLLVAALATVAVTMLLAGRPLWRQFTQGAGWFVLYLLPQAVVISVPLGLLFGILWGTGKALTSGRVRARVLFIALLCSVFSFSMLAWGVPTANQAFRQATFERISGERRVIPRGPNELTLRELGRSVRVVSDTTGRAELSAKRRGSARDYFSRSTVASAPLAFAVFALRARAQRHRGVVARGIAGLAAVCCFLAVMVVFERAVLAGRLSPFVAIAAANVLFVGVSLLVVRIGDAFRQHWFAPRAPA